MKPLPRTNSNSFIGNSALIFLSRLFPSLANLAVIIYFSHKLDTSVVGVYMNFWVRLYFIAAFAGMGIQPLVITYQPAVLVRFLKKLKPAHYAGFLLWLGICAFAFAVLQRNDVGERLLPFCFLAVFVAASIVEGFLLVFRSLYTLIIVNLLHACFFCWMHYSFVQESQSLDQLFLYLLVLMFLKLVLFGLVVLRNLSQPIVRTLALPKKADVRSLWLHLGFFDVSQVVFTWIDKFIIGWIFTSSVSAIYNNGARDVPFLPLLMGAVGSAALMQLSVDSDEEAPIVVMNKSGRVLSSIIFPLFFFLVFFRYEIFEIVFSNKYLQSVPIFLMAIMVLPLRVNNFTVVLQNKHKGNIINIGAVLDLVLACVLMYPLFLVMGLPGVAFSFVISTYLQAAYYTWHTARILNVSWLKLLPVDNWLIKLIVFFTLFIAIHYFLSQYYTTRIVLICGILLAAFISGMALLLEIKTTKRKYGTTPQA